MISFTSDKFSTYAIVKTNKVGQAGKEQYTDEPNGDAEELDIDIDEDAVSVNEAEEAEESDSVRTSDNTNMFIYAAGLGLALAGIVLYERKRRCNN